MSNDFTMQQKVKVINKLIDSGHDTEKKLAKLDTQSILAIKGITIPDMQIIIQLQEAIKGNKLFSYLGGGTDEQKD